MTVRLAVRSGMMATALLFGLVLTAPPAVSDGSPQPQPPSTPRSSPAPAAGGSDPGAAPRRATKSKKKKKTKKQKKAEQQFYQGYRVAYNLVQAGKYEEAIAAFRALKQDDHPDVANYIGFASRKLGRYADAQAWYERALRADPKHVRTWQYYGMWHVEQGNMLKAADHLEKIRTLCGGETCKEFADLKGAMAGTVVY